MAEQTWETVELHGGPMDGEHAYVRTDDPDPGTALLCDRGRYGAGGRCWYQPDAAGVWRWVGDSA